jgi:hypothetical protein
MKLESVQNDEKEIIIVTKKLGIFMNSNTSMC